MIQVVVGTQWGDEGKGKIVDLLAQKADAVVRFHGGPNAGHTVINKFGTFPLHLMPSGAFNPRSYSIISGNVVLDLETLISEIETVKKVVPEIKSKLFISPRCHIIMPYHKLLDRLYEEAKGGKRKTGTTGRGIGPVHADKVSYNGIRLYDLVKLQQFKDKLEVALLVKNKIIEALGEKPLKFTDVYEQKIAEYKKLRPFIRESVELLHELVGKKKRILYEGAQGFYIDNDWGTYPFVTASSTVAGSITASSGVPAQKINEVIGVAKAYTTRVGNGPFPCELFDKIGDKIREVGHEFGTTTGRPRRCGWFDAELVRFAAQVNGATSIALMKLDVLDGFETIKLCIGYTYKSKKVRVHDGDANFLYQVKPIFKTMKGWKTSLKGITSFAKLPKEAKEYIKEIEKQVGVKAGIISVGPERNETIIRHY